MHEIIQEFGKEVVRQESPQEPGRRSRLWHHDDVLKVLEENSVSIQVHYLVIFIGQTANMATVYYFKCELWLDFSSSFCFTLHYGILDLALCF